MHHKEFKHADGIFIKFYAINQYWKFHQLGHLDYFFDRVQPEQENEDETKDTPFLEADDDHLNGEIHTTQTITALIKGWVLMTITNPFQKIFHNQIMQRFLLSTKHGDIVDFVIDELQICKTTNQT